MTIDSGGEWNNDGGGDQQVVAAVVAIGDSKLQLEKNKRKKN